jgi:ureidoglycolate lyase
MQTIRDIIVEPLEAEAFAPFGEVLVAPMGAGRDYFEGALSSLRPGAWPSISLSRRLDVSALPLVARQMERHEFSSQSFIPVETGRWLVVVAPHLPAGGPDVTKLRAFVARPDQGVTYGANVWHHPLAILDRPATFAVVMWRDGTTTDEEFVDLAEPLRLVADA